MSCWTSLSISILHSGKNITALLKFKCYHGRTLLSAHLYECEYACVYVFVHVYVCAHCSLLNRNIVSNTRIENLLGKQKQIDQSINKISHSNHY